MANERPVYVRLREAICDAILDGQFNDGDPLPSVRSLAVKYGANPLTVAKAYQSFQDDGLVHVRRGVGLFVANGASAKLRVAERRVFIEEEWPLVQQRIERLGFDLQELSARSPA